MNRTLNGSFILQTVKSNSTIESLELAGPKDLSQYSKAITQMLFVFSVLGLADHHSANMGFDALGNPYIVDFTITGRRLKDTKNLYEGVQMSKKINAILPSFDERVIISTEYLVESKFADVLDNYITTFIEQHKSNFDRTNLVFDKLNKTDDLLEYIDIIRKNISLFVNNTCNQRKKMNS